MPTADVLEPMLAWPGGYVWAFLIGTLFGSFANVCIYRWPPTDEHPNGRSVVRPGSHCGACGKPVRWYDNLPIVSYLLLRGRCRDCGTGFSPRYMFVEILTGALFVAVFHFAVHLAYFDDPLPLRLHRFLILAALVFVLVVITFIDLDHKLILDKITLPAIPAFYLLGLTLPEVSYTDGLIGAVVGYGVIRGVSDAYYFLTGREGLGYGDGKLLAVVGALLGWKAVLFSLFGGSILGSVIGIGALLVSRGRAAPTDEAVSGESVAEQTAAAGPQPEPAATWAAALPADGAADPTPDPDQDAAPADPAEVPLRHMELPFGPFLAAAALGYVFAAPWLEVALVGWAAL